MFDPAYQISEAGDWKSSLIQEDLKSNWWIILTNLWSIMTMGDGFQVQGMLTHQTKLTKQVSKAPIILENGHKINGSQERSQETNTDLLELAYILYSLDVMPT